MSCFTSLITLVLLMWKWMDLFLRKNHLLKCCGWLSLPNWIGAVTLSLLLKVAQKKLEPFFFSWGCSVTLLITIQPCIKYYCQVWASALSHYLEMLDKLQKRIYRTVGPSLVTSLEPLARRQNVASLSLFYRCYFGRYSSELAQLVPLSYSWGSSTHHSDKLHDFSVTIPRCYKDDCVNFFFPLTARLWSSAYRMLSFELWSKWL